MRVDRVQGAIDMMAEVARSGREFDMSIWVHALDKDCWESCGASGCLGGWMARWPAFVEQGLRLEGAEPVFDTKSCVVYGVDAIAEFLNVPREVSHWLCLPSYYHPEDCYLLPDEEWEGVDSGDIRPEAVICRLEWLRDHGSRLSDSELAAVVYGSTDDRLD